MAGRRWKEAVAKQSKSLFHDELDGEEPVVVIGGPSNTYTHYITTEEEYQIQRYEGASTLYGPHTLAGHVNRSLALMQYLGSTSPPVRPPGDTGPLPPDNSGCSWSLIPGVFYDGTPWFRHFGEVTADVAQKQYTRGDRVRATFVGANPRNNLRLEGTYAAVEYRRRAEDPWAMVRDDSDWGLIFHWRRLGKLRGTSEVEIVWEIEESALSGEYRLRYYGDSKTMIGGRITPFEGTSKSFRIL